MKAPEDKNIATHTLATIVLYHTSLEQSITFQTLNEALEGASEPLDVLVYDNSPSKMYTGAVYPSWNIHYYHDPANSGLSRAFNEASELARKLNKRWLLLLDQDTSFPRNTFQAYADSIAGKTSGMFAPVLTAHGKIVSPFKARAGEGSMLHHINPEKHSFDQLMPVNSGLLVSITDFVASGGYNESFPLDYSDFAFMERYKKIHADFEVIDVTCQHGFSGIQKGDRQMTLDRFTHFCQATRRYRSQVDARVNVAKIILKRALKLTFVFRSGAFLKVAVSVLLKGK